MLNHTLPRIAMLLGVLIFAVVGYRWWSADSVVAEQPPAAMEAGDFVPSTRPGKVSFLALGDSYTIGEGVAANDRWPMQTAAAVRAADAENDSGNRSANGSIDLADPAILARTGWTTGELLAAMDAAPLAPSYDCVTLMIGVNNQYRHLLIDEFREQFQTLLARAIKLTGGKAGRVIVLSIPDWGVTKFAARMQAGNVSPDIDRFNAACRELTGKAGAVWVDITPISRADAKDDSEFAADGLHPSAKQYVEWAKLAAPAIEAAMK